MGSEMSVCFYLVIGIGVAAALWIGNDSRSEAIGMFQTLTAPLFWPIYIPVLLTRRNHQSATESLAMSESNANRDNDGMASLIVQVETELDAALSSLNGWAENVLSGEQHRIAELRTAWRQQASHIRELDRLLIQPSIEFPAGGADSSKSAASTEVMPPGQAPVTPLEQPATRSTAEDQDQFRISEYERSRRENLLKLKQLRRQMYDDLLATLAWVRELVTMIHLAKYSGAPASRALELVRQIAAAVEGLSKNHRSMSQS